MYYFTPETIAEANKNIENLDSKVGGLLCVLYCLKENIEENVSYTIDGEKLRRQLSIVFDKNPRNSYENAKSSYIIFAKGWMNTFFCNIIKNKVDLLSCAVFFLRRHGFEREATKEEVVNLFVNTFHLCWVKNYWFLDEEKLTLFYNQSEVEDNQAAFYDKMNYVSEFKSILFHNVIQKSAADLKAAGHIQTLYSGSAIQKCFLLSDEPLDQYYIMKNSRSTDETKYMDTYIHSASNEYQRAAQIIKNHIMETGFAIPYDKISIKHALSEFHTRFNPASLEALTDENLLQNIFYTSGDNSDALCYWLEAKKEYRDLFGSIAGGSAFKFALFQKKETGNWTTCSSQKPQELSDEEALELGKHIRDKLVVGVAIVKNADLQTIADYEKLDADIQSAIGDKLYNLAWVHKYYSLICPEKLSGFHSALWQCHALRCLKVKPSDKYYVRSGQLAMIENYAGMQYGEFFSVLYDKFGGIKQFFRLGTTDEIQNYASAWKHRSVIGLGWKKLGPLTEYVSGDGLDRGAIADKLSEEYYTGDARTSSRKAGEIVRFYKTDADCIVVAMDGEKLIAFIDEIGEYFYDSSSEMAHMKSGKWHSCFGLNDKLPAKTEGKLTTCTQLSDEDNLMYLYEKYYYGIEEIEEEDNVDYAEDSIQDNEDADIEERNRRLFRYWMTMQIKPEGDSDAGQPYSKISIDQYVSNVANTVLHGNPSKSVFGTVQTGLVQSTIDDLENTEKKNNTQRSAVRKYLQFLIAMKEGNMPLNYKTEIESIYERNRIVFGAPGTGKSFALKKDTEDFLKGTCGTMERVTFHPDYTYSQFVGTYKPVSEAGTIKYEFVPGPFMRVFVDAVKSGMTEKPQPHVLVIEEINRAKVAAVFGDVFQLLDRDDDGVSEYDIQTSEDIRKYLATELGGKPSNYARIRIPNNMFIWATMNSADQGVFPMDTAFKRRWSFEYLDINKNETEIRGKLMLGTDDVQKDVSWNLLRRAINEKLAKEYKVNEDKLMGPFFLSKKVIKTISETDDTILDRAKFIDTFKSKVIMYLYEDAAKQHKHKLFSGCEDTTKYSAICNSFERIGMQIFGEDFKETYYNPQEEA